ncbi:MAG: type I-U CRISPR-associated RAMP protein Csb1/Cas7u [Rhodospirillaceae bacterium]|nr:type I-U CRISPR-associated RAMP protein Csb1/Cas7u [Rhodospirillaceae bacterium]
MARRLDLAALLAGCADNSFDDGIRIDSHLEPLSGPGGAVKPAAYEGGIYQFDRRWASPDDDEPTPVIVIDNVPSQANRLEEALRQNRESSSIPEFVLDLSKLPRLPAHLPRSLSSLQFPHRNADAYLRDSQLEGEDFLQTQIGRAIFGATAQTCGPLMSWFPQALLYGFWQSHLGKKRQNTRHARAWVSEIVGWQPAATQTRVLGLKGDVLNLNTDDVVTSKPDDRTVWEVGRGARIAGAKSERLSEIGHGRVALVGTDARRAAVSFVRVTQRATVSFAQLRRVSLGVDSGESDTAARALLVALGLYAHQLAFGRGFALRSGAELRPQSTTTTWLGAKGDETIDLGGAETTLVLLEQAREHAASQRVPLDGWGSPATILTPKKNLSATIRSTWPELD